jgi:hypothetical protein
MNEDALTIALRAQVKGLTNYLDPADFRQAIANATRDTGWALPVTTDFKIKWTLERSKRHLFFFLQTESAHKFKFEQINLQHRFEHYDKLIAQMDKSFEKAIEDNPHEFSGAETFALFGSKVDAGFAYDSITGRDITYDEDNEVLFTPTENS